MSRPVAPLPWTRAAGLVALLLSFAVPLVQYATWPLCVLGLCLLALDRAHRRPALWGVAALAATVVLAIATGAVTAVVAGVRVGGSAPGNLDALVVSLLAWSAFVAGATYAALAARGGWAIATRTGALALGLSAALLGVAIVVPAVPDAALMLPGLAGMALTAAFLVRELARCFRSAAPPGGAGAETPSL